METLELKVARAVWRLETAERRHSELEALGVRLERELRELNVADEIARQVSERLEQERKLVLTVGQKTVGALFALVVFADALRGLVS